ncbi:MAG: Smr/MutS family protein [Oligoflexus sp.]
MKKPTDHEQQKDINQEEPLIVPITDELDLHTFQPKDLKYLIPDYIDACLEKGIFSVRIIHGKGKGHLLRSVHALLKKNPNVESFRLGNETSGSWGATLVEICSGKNNKSDL